MILVATKSLAAWNEEVLKQHDNSKGREYNNTISRTDDCTPLVLD